jgi:hypothetical protein
LKKTRGILELRESLLSKSDLCLIVGRGLIDGETGQVHCVGSNISQEAKCSSLDLSWLYWLKQSTFGVSNNRPSAARSLVVHLLRCELPGKGVMIYESSSREPQRIIAASV